MRISLRIALLLAACLFSVWTTVAQETHTASFIEYEVISDTANLRAEPSTNAAIAGRAVKGDVLRAYADQETAGWYKVQLEDGSDAYIADFLVQRAPDRLYPIDQEPIFVAEGEGSEITDSVVFPEGLYRVDYTVTGDNNIEVRLSPLDGDCFAAELRSDMPLGKSTGSFSIRSRDCEGSFVVNGTRGKWKLEIRPTFIAGEFDEPDVIRPEGEVTFTGSGYHVTPAMILEKGAWSVEATADGDSIIVSSTALENGCVRDAIIVEIDMWAPEISGSGVYQVRATCTVMWRVAMVEDGKSWSITIRKLR